MYYTINGLQHINITNSTHTKYLLNQTTTINQLKNLENFSFHKMRLSEKLSDKHRALFLDAPVYFVATAPLSSTGRVNVSPKGLQGTLIFLDQEIVQKLGIKPQKDSKCFVCYLDVGGSGIETYAHIKEPGNGRVTLMTCSWQGSPSIVRLYGQGYGFEPQDKEQFTLLQSLFNKEVVNKFSCTLNGQQVVRNYIVVDVTRIADSCGYAVPYMKFQSHRTIFDDWFQNKTDEQIENRRKTCNTTSNDGLTGLKRLNQTQKQNLLDILDSREVFMGLVFMMGFLLGIFITQKFQMY
eukprot:TRINITY_DN22774_c0_g2_i1.p1 TRINITY_DN22774_c0_g2~~TRINITY_DN22774_c0_g2_i1.p1  ORF type:complete len:295 (-),score=16.85 TRINITY_DN22774_c0_g2_i1:329-1213(-)